MAASRHGCTSAQQSMCSSNPLPCTSRFSAVVAELLISRHVPCHKHLFCVQKFHFRRISRDYRGNHQNSCQKAGIPEKIIVKGRDAALYHYLQMYCMCVYVYVCVCARGYVCATVCVYVCGCMSVAMTLIYHQARNPKYCFH